MVGRIIVKERWKLDVDSGPAEHGVYKYGALWLAPTFLKEYWKVDPERGVILQKFPMQGIVWGAPWIDKDGVYGATEGGVIRKFNHKGEIVWTIRTDLGDFIAESITEAWGKYIAVQFPKGIALVDKERGEVVWSDEWSPEGRSGQEPTYDQDEKLLWVCKPISEDNLISYNEEGKVIHKITLPDYPTTYACPQIWGDYIAVICNRHIVVVDKRKGRIVWSLDLSRIRYGGKDEDALVGGPRTITPDGKLILWTIDGLYVCFDLRTGTILWRIDLMSLGYTTRDNTAYWSYGGLVATDGIAVFLGRNNLPEGNEYAYNRNRLFVIDYEVGKIVYTSDPKYKLACCCKPILAKGKVIIGTWYKDSENREFTACYYCWEIKGREERRLVDKPYEWMGGLHHGGYGEGYIELS